MAAITEHWLTGSRYFGTATAGSDFDYFAEDSAANRSRLEASGFACVWEAIRADGELRALYRRQDPACAIDFQLVRNARRRALVQGLVRKAGFGPAIREKRFSHRFWRLLWEVAEMAKGEQ